MIISRFIFGLSLVVLSPIYATQTAEELWQELVALPRDETKRSDFIYEVWRGPVADAEKLKFFRRAIENGEEQGLTYWVCDPFINTALNSPEGIQQLLDLARSNHPRAIPALCSALGGPGGDNIKRRKLVYRLLSEAKIEHTKLKSCVDKWDAINKQGWGLTALLFYGIPLSLALLAGILLLRWMLRKSAR